MLPAPRLEVVGAAEPVAVLLLMPVPVVSAAVEFTVAAADEFVEDDAIDDVVVGPPVAANIDVTPEMKEVAVEVGAAAGATPGTDGTGE